MCKEGQQLIQNYWSPDIQLRAQGFSDHANIEAKIRDCIDEIVTEQTISDVPLGLFLSGGIDSSTLAAAVGKKGLSCLAINCEFDKSSNSERAKAETTAKSSG